MKYHRFFMGFLLSVNISFTHAQPIDSKGTVCWPLNFAGIVVGVTKDSQAERLLGKGIFRKDEGEAGGRYYVDEGARASLHIVSYTDSVVGELTLMSGIDPAIQKGELSKGVSKWFDPSEGFGNWHALHLGSSTEDVLKNLGKPKKGHGDQWVYSTRCSCEIPEYLTLFFDGGHLYKIVLSAPAG